MARNVRRRRRRERKRRKRRNEGEKEKKKKRLCSKTLEPNLAKKKRKSAGEIGEWIEFLLLLLPLVLSFKKLLNKCYFWMFLKI